MIAKKKQFNLGGIMKAKNYKSITEVLDKKYNKGIVNKKDKINFYSFMDLEDCENRIKQKRKDQQ